MKWVAWMRGDLWTYRWRLLSIVILSVLTAGCASALLFTSGYLISRAALRPENILMVYVPIVLVRTFGIGRAVMHYAERLVGHDLVLRILAKMRVQLYRVLEPQALWIQSRYRTGDVLSTLAEDVEQLQDVYVRIVFPTVTAVVIYLFCVAALGWFDLPFALLMALYLSILVFILPGLSLWVTYRRQRRMKRGRNELYRRLTDAVSGVSDWLISGRAPAFICAYEAAEARVASLERDLRRWERVRTLVAQSVAGVAVILMVYWAGQQSAAGELAPTWIAAFALTVFPLMDVFLPLSEALEKIPQYEDSLDRIQRMEFSEAPSAPRQGRVSQSVLERAEKRAAIRLQEVSYRYGNTDRWSVDQVFLDIPQGKKVAIIGRSGAGKSTLLKLLQGLLIPERGRVTINGVEADRFSDDISRVISVLNQRPHLFDTSVANNIRLGQPDASNEAIRRVAKQVQLDRLIESLPSGYDTPMLEMGARFSGGERQRIALARILLQRTPVILLDEPTVGLDPRTERDLLRTIFQETEGKTIIWVTHHLVGVEQMDEVVMLEEGRVAMRGSHAQLIEESPRYRKLHRLDRPV